MVVCVCEIEADIPSSQQQVECVPKHRTPPGMIERKKKGKTRRIHSRRHSLFTTIGAQKSLLTPTVDGVVAKIYRGQLIADFIMQSFFLFSI